MGIYPPPQPWVGIYPPPQPWVGRWFYHQFTGEKTEVQQGSITCMMTGSSSHGNTGPSDSCSALSCFLLSLSPLILLCLMETRSRKKAWERERIKDNEASLSSLDHRIPSQTGYWQCPPTLFNMLVSPPHPRLTEEESQRLVRQNEFQKGSAAGYALQPCSGDSVPCLQPCPLVFWLEELATT